MVRKIGYDGVNLGRRHKIRNSVLDVAFHAVDPFSMEGVELRLGGLADSSYKYSKNWFSFGTREVEEDHVALAQETVVRVPVLEVAWADQTRRVFTLIFLILVWAAEIVDVAQTSKVVCLFARGVDIVVVDHLGMQVSIFFMPFAQLVSYIASTRPVGGF